MTHCHPVCACLDVIGDERSLPEFRVWTLGSEQAVNISAADFCTLGHELPRDSAWQNRTGRDVLRVMLTSYLAPPVIVITVLTNITICVVLTRKHMVSPTNIILLAMALVDMLTETTILLPQCLIVKELWLQTESQLGLDKFMCAASVGARM